MEYAAPGQVCCDGEVYLRARQYWAFEALPPVQPKGRPEASPVYRPTGRRAADGRPLAEANELGVLVGRQAEVERLRSLLAALATGEAGNGFLQGEAGNGKT